MAKRLAVVGAGPKAAALVARAAVLRDFFGAARVPEILVFDKNGIAADWDGVGQYSNGFISLCTPGEKDVGFPYLDFGYDELDNFANSIASELHSRFSWSAYLVANGHFADWVDRDRSHPSHARFASYLRWVFSQAGAKPIIANVSQVWRAGDKWCVDYGPPQKSAQVVVDAIVLTGNGEAREVALDPAVPPGRVFNAATFWTNRHLFVTDRKIEVAVAGDGGSAGTIVAWLVDRFAETGSRIWSVSPMGTLFPRGDGHAERRWFTDPSEWQSLSITHRRKLIERTEAGVVSLRNKSGIDRSDRVAYEAGHVASIAIDDEDKLALKLTYSDRGARPLTVDFVVNAIGFDPWSRLRLVNDKAARAIAGPTPGALATSVQAVRDRIELLVEPDLSLPKSEGFPPGLHVPALAGLAHGPGMGNLGCLGLMASKILDGYIEPKKVASRP